MSAKFLPLTSQLQPTFAMPSIKFLIQHAKKEAKNRHFPIYIRIYNGRMTDVKAKTDFCVTIADWDLKNQRPRKKSAYSKTLNISLERLKLMMEQRLLEASTNGEVVNSAWLRAALQNKTDESKPATLLSYIDHFLIIRDSELKEDYKKRMKLARGFIEGLQKVTRREYLGKDVNLDFKREFEKFGLKNGYSHNTIQQYLKYTKRACTFAKQEGLPTSAELDGIKFKFKKVKVVYLTEKEIDKISNLRLDSEALENARDWLLISCYTGQRHSDFNRFTKEMLRAEYDTRKNLERTHIDFVQLKTNRHMIFPLSADLMSVLDKRNGDFPRPLSNQKLNDYIKDVCKAAGIDEQIEGTKICRKTKKKVAGKYPKYELVSSHIGRRSFATNHYAKIPTPLIMAITGHSSERSFLTYVGKSDPTMAGLLTEYF